MLTDEYLLCMILVLQIFLQINISYDISFTKQVIKLISSMMFGFTNIFANEYPIVDPSSSPAVYPPQNKGKGALLPANTQRHISSANIPYRERKIYFRKLSTKICKTQI